MELEDTWAIALKKTRGAERLKSATPLAVRKNQVADRMLYEKNQLMGAVTGGDAQGKKRALDALIQLRADLMALELEEIQEIYGNIETPALEAEMQKYYEDCYRLAAATAS